MQCKLRVCTYTKYTFISTSVQIMQIVSYIRKSYKSCKCYRSYPPNALHTTSIYTKYKFIRTGARQANHELRVPYTPYVESTEVITTVVTDGCWWCFPCRCCWFWCCYFVVSLLVLSLRLLRLLLMLMLKRCCCCRCCCCCCCSSCCCWCWRWCAMRNAFSVRPRWTVDM